MRPEQFAFRTNWRVTRAPARPSLFHIAVLATHSRLPALPCATLKCGMPVCKVCDGVGLVRVMDAAGKWVSRPCECQALEREERRLTAARIPPGYWDCTLDGYDTAFPGADPSQGWALKMARCFVDSYPVDTDGKGLLFIGSLGVGKTHLAVGVLRRLIQERGVRGIFCDYGALLKEIQRSFNPRNNITEFDLLEPILSAEVLVLDDLGAQKPTDWLWD